MFSWTYSLWMVGRSYVPLCVTAMFINCICTWIYLKYNQKFIGKEQAINIFFFDFVLIFICFLRIGLYTESWTLSNTSCLIISVIEAFSYNIASFSFFFLILQKIDMYCDVTQSNYVKEVLLRNIFFIIYLSASILTSKHILQYKLDNNMAKNGVGLITLNVDWTYFWDITFYNGMLPWLIISTVVIIRQSKMIPSSLDFICSFCNVYYGLVMVSLTPSLISKSIIYPSVDINNLPGMYVIADTFLTLKIIYLPIATYIIACDNCFQATKSFWKNLSGLCFKTS